MTLYVGCPMWGLKTWVGNFFPPGTKPKDFLVAYSRRLNAVEGNTTFYALPDTDTIARWRDATPPGFKFCLKVPQAISHHKRLRSCDAEAAAFADRLRLLGDRRGPAFLQLPPVFGAPHLRALDAWLAAWPTDLSIAVEPRHADFFGPAEADFDALLRQHGAARCVFDTKPLFSVQATCPEVAEAQARKPRFPTRYTRTATFAFVRYVGHPDVAANRPWLREWASHAAPWLAGGDDVYFFCHHPDDTYAPMLVRLFHRLLSEQLPEPLPPLPDWNGGDPAAQSSLFGG
ncbi:MAG: DUF72 domain-containing protein [Anaerolineae bacterium]|nr:DUF72 domain-containing protein [Candidatus Roseilinea sp.]MDW8450477.1 DUF72 domain-containing protein [Anaerolineae bacterium]